MLSPKQRISITPRTSLQETADDLLLGFLFGQAEGHELVELLAGDLADGGLVDEAGLDGVGRDLRARADGAAVHDDGVALRVTGALVVAADVGVEHLAGVILGDGAGDDVRAGIIAVEVNGEVRLRVLMAVRHDLFLDDERGAVRQVGLRVAVCGVDALDLGRLHLHVGVLAEVDDRRRVHDVLAVAVALAVVLFDVAHPGVLADEEAVDAVVAGLLRAAVVDAAAGDDGHIAVLADVKVIVDHVLEAGLGNDDRDVHALVFRAGGDVNVDAGLVFLRDDVDVRGRVAAEIGRASCRERV